MDIQSPKIKSLAFLVTALTKQRITQDRFLTRDVIFTDPEWLEYANA